MYLCVDVCDIVLSKGQLLSNVIQLWYWHPRHLEVHLRVRNKQLHLMRPVPGHDGSVGAVAVKHQSSDFHTVLIGVTCGDHGDVHNVAGAPGLLPQAGRQTVPGQGELAAVHGAAVPEDVGAGGGEEAEVLISASKSSI